jgi:hypothetical protein
VDKKPALKGLIGYKSSGSESEEEEDDDERDQKEVKAPEERVSVPGQWDEESDEEKVQVKGTDRGC